MTGIISKKNLKKKYIAGAVTALYISVMIASVLYVPVKAVLEITKHEVYTDYGYYPIWDVIGQNPPEAGVKVSFNMVAWSIQVIFLTMLYISIYIRIARYYRRKERSNSLPSA